MAFICKINNTSQISFCWDKRFSEDHSRIFLRIFLGIFSYWDDSNAAFICSFFFTQFHLSILKSKHRFGIIESPFFYKVNWPKDCKILFWFSVDFFIDFTSFRNDPYFTMSKESHGTFNCHFSILKLSLLIHLRRGSFHFFDVW